jgi:hypothetical protein
MAITISVQDNPNRDLVGSTDADATIINSGFTSGIITYEIQRLDDHQTIVSIKSNADISQMSQVVKLSEATLHIILPFRTDFRVKVRQGTAAWSSWSNFKTRDKRYQTPDAITQLSDNLKTSAAKKGSKTITVTNSAKATVTETNEGAAVDNTSDYGYSDTTSVVDTSSGATVTNTTKITYTNRGANVDND